MRTFDDMLSKQLKDDEFRKEYESIQSEMNQKTVRVATLGHKTCRNNSRRNENTPIAAK